MRLSDLCIRRPVFATMLIVSLVVLGLASYRDLGLDAFPRVEFPTITVTTTLEGATPEEVESQITKPIEEVVNTINGIDELRSTTKEGISQVFVTFVLEKPVEVAANEVRDKVATILDQFPPGTNPPVIEKLDPDATPILAIVVSGPRSAREITEIADKRIKRQIETVNGVGSLTFVGDRKREIQIQLDADKLAAYSLAVEQVKQAVQQQNAEIPGGRITKGQREEGLRTLGRIDRAEDFNRLIVADVKGAPVRVADVGRAVDGIEEPRTLSRLNGENAVSLLVRKQSGTNTVQVVDRVRQRLLEIRRTLPPDARAVEVRDLSRFIRRSMKEVQEHLILGGILASIVVCFFIRNLRAAFIAALAIPTSIIGTFTLLKYMGFTLNNQTMLGLSLSVGIVIDDAIVVLENIFRYMEEEGVGPMEAAQQATREIGLAVMATTLSLVVIFLPVAFMSGIVGRFFNSFGLTASFAILISLLVSFTLIPSLSSRLLKPPAHGGEARGRAGAASKQSGFYAALDRTYDWLLRWALGHRKSVVVLTAVVVASTIAIFPYVKKEFVVDDDMSEFEVVLETPAGSSLERSDDILRRVEAELKKLPGVETLFTNIGVQGQNVTNVTDASIYVGLSHLSKRKETQQQIMQMARVALARFPDLRVSAQQISLISGGGFKQTPFNLVIRGPELDRLERYAQEVMGRLRKRPGFVDLDTSLAARRPEVRVHIDRQKAADLGIRVAAIAGSLRTMVGGEKVSTFREGDEQYNVRVRLLQDFRDSPRVIAQVMVRGSSGRLTQLNNVTEFSTGKAPGQIDRINRERQITVVANLFNKPLGEAIAQADAAVREIGLLPGYSTTYIGRGKLMGEAAQNFLMALMLSLIFIYMVLAALFESFVHPVTIMLSLPLTLPFGLLTLAATGQSLNLNSIIGIFMLMGVVKKNSILQVDYTNTLRERGMERFQAIIEANHARLRPILMTTLSIVFGMVPIAFGRGDGAAGRASMATVVIGGQMLSLLLTLLATPVFYSLFDDLGRRGWVRGLLRAPAAAVWDRFAWGWSRVEGGRRPEVS
ncbi:MAG: RND transporter [candidate division NC10 bacterium RIFCSPLOWO2_02_FULL_66_22]|nr:MAG: RND transporter [candidate division NC10 bacterium RIFCSPLOWO2_02_FULL_66_22]